MLWIPESNWHFIPFGSAKTRIDAKKKGYLIEDYTQNLFKWDGVGIKFCTESNDTRGTWNGYRIYNTSTPDEIVKTILKIMSMD